MIRSRLSPERWPLHGFALHLFHQDLPEAMLEYYFTGSLKLPPPDSWRIRCAEMPSYGGRVSSASPSEAPALLVVCLRRLLIKPKAYSGLGRLLQEQGACAGDYALGPACWFCSLCLPGTSARLGGGSGFKCRTVAAALARRSDPDYLAVHVAQPSCVSWTPVRLIVPSAPTGISPASLLGCSQRRCCGSGAWPWRRPG